MTRWISPMSLDLERIRFSRMKPQHGGWCQSLWIAVQEAWRRA